MCKKQIVDVSRHRQRHEKKIKFQNLILEDDQNDQVQAVVYEDDLGYYAARFSLFNTYLISVARVKKVQVKYSRFIHKFYLMIDKETILEHVSSSDTIERALPLPTKLELAPFATIRDINHSPAAKIGYARFCWCCAIVRNSEKGWPQSNEVS